MMIYMLFVCCRSQYPPSFSTNVSCVLINFFFILV